MSIQVPFNYEPDSVSVKTGSYSIPSGQYAFVTAYCRDGGTFSIGGTVALEADGTDLDGDILTVSESRTSAGTVHATTNGYSFEGHLLFTAGSALTITVGGVTTVTGASPGERYEVKAGPAEDINIGGTTPQGTLVGFERRPMGQVRSIVSGSFWVPASTALTLSGNTRYTVSLYNNIS